MYFKGEGEEMNVKKNNGTVFWLSHKIEHWMYSVQNVQELFEAFYF